MPIVEAVGIASGYMERRHRPLNRRIATAMRRAVVKAQAEGITDPQVMRALIQVAREREKGLQGIEIPQSPAPMTLHEAVEKHQAAELLSQAPMQAMALQVLTGMPRATAIGSALAFLLKMCGDEPALMHQILRGTTVAWGNARCSMLEALNQTR